MSFAGLCARVALDARHRRRPACRAEAWSDRELRRVADVLRQLSLRIKLHADFDLRVDVFADRVQVVAHA